MKTVLNTIILTTLCLYSFAQTPDYTVEQWRMVEISLESTNTYADPFNDVDITATFTGPEGVVLVRPGFWDGNNTWRVRFAPTAIGTWTMTTACTNQSDDGLNGINKEIQCDAYTGDLEIYQRGFLKTGDNNRFFAYNDGTPFFYLGDTHWLFVHERFNTSNVPGIPSQFKYTVDKRIEQGFTVYQSEAIQHPHGGTHDGDDEEPFCNFRDGFGADDLPGFENIDRKFQYIADKGLVHANSTACWAKDPSDFPASYSGEYMEKLGRYWVARYGAYPVMWTIAQEIDNDMYGAYNSTTIKKWHGLAQAMADNDPYNHPFSAHMEETNNTIASNSSWGNLPFHTWWAAQWQENVTGYRTAIDFWYSLPTKPAVLYEGPYEGFWTDTKGARGAGYKAFQMGMLGYGYGANGVWNDLYDDATLDYGTDFEMPQRYLHWYEGANLPGAEQMIHFKQFYTSIDWWKLQPRFDDRYWASFSDVTHSMLATDGQKTFVVYFFGSGRATGTIRNLLNGCQYTAKWFDPRTGDYTDIETFTASNNEFSIPSRPTADDWVLLVQTDTEIPTADNEVNIALSKNYSSSSTWDANQTAAKAFDRNYDTNWQAREGSFANQWLAVDFGEKMTFNKVILSEYGDRTSGFRIEYSDNGSTWQTAYTGTTIGCMRTILFEPVSAKHARIYYTSGSSFAPIIYEFEIYCTVTPSTGLEQSASKQPNDLCVLSAIDGNDIILKYNSSQCGAADIFLYNIAGGLIAYEQHNVRNGANDIPLSSQLNAGVYLVKLIMGNKHSNVVKFKS